MQPDSDLTNCDREPIQWPGFIQSHGYLLALDPVTFTIWQASENVSQLTQLPMEALLGQAIADINLGDLAGTSLHTVLTVATREGTPEAFNPYPMLINGQKGYLILHQHDGALLVEWEPAAESRQELALPVSTLLSQIMSDIQRSTTLAQLLEKTAQKVKLLTGFDRVMIYHFGEDWHGEVIAEAKESHLEPYLGLHYPASDIPRQARELYKTNLIRGIVDVGCPRVPILPVNYTHHQRPLDLTHACLRAVSPLHVEYLQNMGVRSSLSISLLYRGELWGLIACHQYGSPRFVDYPTRQSIKLISQLLSSALEIRKEDEDAEYAQQLHQQQQALYQQMLTDWDIVQGLTKHPITVLDLNSATGSALLFEGRLYTLGDTPAQSAILDLIDWLKNDMTTDMFQTNQLPNLYPPAEVYAQQVSGLLVLRLSREMNEYLLWFKPEQLQSVFWAGNPEKTGPKSDAARLSPRKSFEIWTQLVRHKAQPWRQPEIAMALKLREDLLQVVAQKANQIRALHEQLRLAYEELEAFSFTVSHDLRAPLTSIKSNTEIYLEDYGSSLDEPALAILTKITNASDRMSQLIRNIMQYSRTSRMELTLKPLLIEPLLQQLLDEVLAAEAGRDVSIQIGNTPMLEGDPTMVAQVFSNLLANAVKYSRHAANAQVWVEGNRVGREVIYSVTDNGIGIDMKQAGKVFELFQRLDSATHYEGYGVGLAIVKRIMSRHGGKVWFDSQPHQTTTFYVSFPSINS